MAANVLGPTTLDNDALSATYLSEGLDVADFELVSHTGQPFTNDNLEDRWTLLFFGFTNCPDICPMTMFELAAVSEKLTEKGLNGNLQTVFVTVDPARDTPDMLAEYVPAFDKRFIGVTGALTEIERLTRSVGIAHIRHDASGEDDYMVDHGTAVLLINPNGQMQAVFSSPHRSAAMAADLERIFASHGSGG